MTAPSPTGPDRTRRTGLPTDEDAHALAALLDLVAAELPHLDPAVRWQAVESCRLALDGAPQPRRRWTRRP